MVVAKLIEHGNGLLGKEQHRRRLARIEVRGAAGGSSGQ